MRKSTKIMAGLGVVAGLGVALAPLATFAADPVNLGTDHLTVIVETGCKMTSGTADDTSTSDVDESAYTAFENYYKGTMNAGTAIILGTQQRTTSTGAALANAEQTVLHIQCNNAYPNGNVSDQTTGHGWSIKGKGTVLTGGTTGKTIPNNDPSDGATSGWGVKLSASDTNGDTDVVAAYKNGYKALPSTAGVVAYGSMAGADATVTIDSYKVSASAEQAGDTYTGTAEYTFVTPQA